MIDQGCRKSKMNPLWLVDISQFIAYFQRIIQILDLVPYHSHQIHHSCFIFLYPFPQLPIFTPFPQLPIFTTFPFLFLPNDFLCEHQQQPIKSCNYNKQSSPSFLPSFVRMSAIPNLKYNTTLCLHWLEGPCIPIQVPPASNQPTVNSPTRPLGNPIALRSTSFLIENPTVFCKFSARGECRLSVGCTFAHERREKVQRKSIPHEEEHENRYQQQFAYSQLSAWMAQYGPYLSQQTLQYGNGLLYSPKKGLSFQQDNQMIEGPSPTLSKDSNQTDLSDKLTERSLSTPTEVEADEEQR